MSGIFQSKEPYEYSELEGTVLDFVILVSNLDTREGVENEWYERITVVGESKGGCLKQACAYVMRKNAEPNWEFRAIVDITDHA